ncbi:MAG: hypothetical protein ACK4SO_07275, partial [Candidatus Kapaibacteriota bacterium]
MKFYENIQKLFENKFENNHKYNIDKRRDFLKRFLHFGIPTTKHEEWKYTNLSFINDLNFSVADEFKTQMNNRNLPELEVPDFFNYYIIHILNGYFLDSSNRLNSLVQMSKLDDDSVFFGESFLKNFET